MGEEGPRPGLLILDMSNDQVKGVAYNKAAVISNVAQLALSDFFHVCIDSKEEVPAFRAKQKGAKLVDELVGMDHINHFPKKGDSALTNPKVLESLKSLNVSHVCVCGTSTDSSVAATAADLVSNGFDIFVVKDATTSKNGKFGHDKGLRDIQSKFGDSVVVGIDDLLGAEEIVEETVTGDSTEWVEEVVDDSYVVEEVTESSAAASISPAEKARMSDAEKLAARKKKVDAERFAHIKQVNAAAQAKADPKRAAEIEKDTAEADTYTSNLPQNKAGAAAPAPAAAAPEKQKKKGLFGGMFGKKKNKEPAPAPAPASAPKAAAAPAPKPAAAPAPAPPKIATAVPGGGAGQKTWIKPLPEGQKKTTYTADGAVAQPLGVKKMVQGNAVQERIRGLQEGGIKTVPTGPRKMKTPKVVTDTKETWDKQGNITREITRYITEIDGTKRTEKEIVKIPAKK